MKKKIFNLCNVLLFENLIKEEILGSVNCVSVFKKDSGHKILKFSKKTKLKISFFALNDAFFLYF